MFSSNLVALRAFAHDFQNVKGKVAANALDISVTLFDAIDLENSTFILTRRGAEAILFLTKS